MTSASQRIAEMKKGQLWWTDSLSNYEVIFPKIVDEGVALVGRPCGSFSRTGGRS
jgi:hypothetical protein